MVEVSKTYSGTEFNSYFKNPVFYKITNTDEKHHDFQYKDGLNIDTNTFNPNGACRIGGLYFSTKKKLPLYFEYGIYVRNIIIPDYANVYVEEGKFKADTLFLGKKCLIKDWELWDDNEYCRLAVQQDGKALQYVKEQTEDICRLAVQQNGNALEFVKEEYKTEEICRLAVKQNGNALKYVKEEYKTEEICRLAVQQNELALEYVEHQTEELCRLAVKKNGFVLRSVKEQTEEICRLAILQNPNALQLIEDIYLKNQIIKTL